MTKRHVQASPVATERQKEYYEKVFSGDLGDQWERAPGKDVIVAALRHYLTDGRIEKEAVIVDIGCGAGFLLDRIRREIPLNGFRLYGFDFSREAIDKARHRYPHADFFCEDGASTHLDAASVDVGIAYGSFEHFPEPRAGIREMARILKEGGLFLCMMPSLGIDRTDRSDEGWYEERPVEGSPILQEQWNLLRHTWESYFTETGLSLFPLQQSRTFGAHKPGVFFFGLKA